MTARHHLLILALPIVLSAPVFAGTPGSGWDVTLETGPAWFSRNDVRIPNDEEGDRFDVTELTGNGPVRSMRLGLEYGWGERHAATALFAPFRASGSSALKDDVRFKGETFTGGESLKATYKFNTYRLGYRYSVHETEDWRLRVGGSLLVRDADVRLSQGNTTADDPDLGFVPLLAFEATRYFNSRWSLAFDVEGLGAPQGRAIDAALALQYRWDEALTVRLGYRTLEGGADNDSVYTFAWVHYGLAGLRYAF